jgi:predicted aldo/keto reductase-like oxidoreductase
VEQHINALTADLGITRDQVAGFALRYVVAEPAVSTVIAGMRTIRNVERNTSLDAGPDLTAEQRAVLARHRREKNFYPS